MKSADELDEMARPLTPLSDRHRPSYGSLLMSVQTVPGRCCEAKCIRKAAHPGECWPKEA